MKRGGPLQRKTPLRSAAAEQGPYKPPKPVKCKAPGCDNRFVRARMEQKACGWQCAMVLGRLANEKAAARAALEDRRQTRAQLEALKTVPQLKKEAQREFNRYIRLRDAHQPCISCGAPPPDMNQLHAGRDAGHYRSTGSADHLRFHEDNCHAQCVKCNQWGAGMAVDYRIGLVQRIGLWRVEALESLNRTVKWTREGLRATRDVYRSKSRFLLASAANDARMKKVA